MSRQPVEALSATSTSYDCRTTLERRLDACHSPYRLRSQSLDYLCCEMSDHSEEINASPAATCLRGSFEATLLDEDHEESIFRRSNRVSDASAWDEFADGERSGRKHHLQRKILETTTILPPGTIRKLPRRMSNPCVITSTPVSETPVRSHSRPPTAKQTPSSASRRRRAPMLQRDSPYRKSPYKRPPHTRALKQHEQINALVSLSNPTLGTPTHTTPLYNKLYAVMKPETGHTATTVETSIDATTVDSQDASSPNSTPFRFASFPASLPRINPRSFAEMPSPLDGPVCPTTVRKRMNFSSDQAALERECNSIANSSKTAIRYFNLSTASSCSRDDDGTQNSSVSSISADPFTHMHTVPSFPPPPFSKRIGIDSKFSDDSDMPETQTKRPSSSLNTKLFTYDHDEYEDSEDASPIGINVTKTRLNFNTGTSPSEKKLERQRLEFDADGEERNQKDHADESDQTNAGGIVSSTQNTVQSQNMNMNIYEENALHKKTPLSPARSGILGDEQMTQDPSTPDELQIHFHVNGTQCSPIPGISEEDGNNDMDLELSCSPRIQVESDTSRCSENEETAKLSISQASSASSTSSKLRRLRPMPDITAFDASVRSGASRNEKSGEDIFPHLPQSPKLLCPPTPVRTPAWAHNEQSGNPFVRTNSLIVTKVLAMCPVQIVDGHSSLENSLIDDEVDKCQNHVSFPMVDEEMDEQQSPLRQVTTDSAIDSSALTASWQSPSFPTLPRVSDEPFHSVSTMPKTPLLSNFPTPKPLSMKNVEGRSMVSFLVDFENLGQLGRGSFADVYKVRSKQDGQLYAVKKNRRQFRGKRDRDLAMTEVRIMQTLQNVCAQGGNNDGKEKVKGSYSLYVLFFYRAWQEEGYFFCQTELCCRDTCRELHDSLTTDWQIAVRKYPSLLTRLPPSELNSKNDLNAAGRLIPGPTIWKICHDVSAGLSHIHSCGIVHRDIKPSNIFFVSHPRFGAMCKIGDLGMAGEIGSCEDGQEGDTIYMAPELLTSGVKQPSADIFSLGLTLYELAAGFGWELPSEGPRWHDLRSGSHVPELSSIRCQQLVTLIQMMIQEQSTRPCADDILKEVVVSEAGSRCDEFLRDYINDTENFERRQERASMAQRDAFDVVTTPRHTDSGARELCTPIPGMPLAPSLFKTPSPVTN